MDSDMQNNEKTAQDDSKIFLKKVAINNLISLAISCVVIAFVFATVVMIEAVTGYGMGSEIFLMPIALGAHVYLGYKFLVPTHKHLWMSVLALPMIALLISILLHIQTSLPFGEFFVAFIVALVLSLFMYIGLEVKVRNGDRASEENGERR